MERLLVTSVFGAVAFAAAVYALAAVDTALATGTAAAWAVAAYELLRFGVLQTFTVLVAIRRDSIRPSREPIAFAACAAAFLSFALLKRPSELGGAGLAIAGDTVAAVFEAWLLISVFALGKCFGILPEARGVVTRGPYRLVRHPVYLGEIGAIAGLAIAAGSVWNAAIALVGVGAQLVRIRLEERELAANFPAYREYAATKPMLVPVPRRRRRERHPLPNETFPVAAVSTPTSRGSTNQ